MMMLMKMMLLLMMASWGLKGKLGRHAGTGYPNRSLSSPYVGPRGLGWGARGPARADQIWPARARPGPVGARQGEPNLVRAGSAEARGGPAGRTKFAYQHLAVFFKLWYFDMVGLIILARVPPSPEVKPSRPRAIKLPPRRAPEHIHA